jgi:tRNA modification GTPase
VESLGIQRARSQAAQADLIWYLVDANIGLTPKDEQEIASFAPPVWKIVNKIDNHKTIPPATIGISTYTGEGIAQLIQQVSELVPELGGVVPNRRHSKSLTSVRESVEAILMGIQYHHPDDLLVTHFRSALFELGQITGTSASTDLLERIFSDFCIGK